jgi:hypothetical protein
MIRNFLIAGLLSTALLAPPALAQVQPGQLKKGQIIYFNYCGEMTEAKVLEDDNGKQVRIEAKNPLSKQYDGSNTRYAELSGVMLSLPGAGGAAGAGGGFTPGAGGGGMPGANADTVQPQAGGQYTKHTAQQQQSTAGGGTPRMGRYHMYGFPSMYKPMQLVGWFDLMAGGTYKTQAGGTGTYTLGGSGIQWLTGPYKDQGFLGIVRIDRGGLTSRITLTKTAGGNDRMVAFCSADK